MKTIHVVLLSMLLAGCASIPENTMVGTWSMHKVLQDGQDVTSEHDPYHERFLVLNPDSSFESGGRPFGENSGSYLYNPIEHTLYLDSDAGPEDDSRWKVSISGDTMHWQGYGSEWAKAFELIHVRKKE